MPELAADLLIRVNRRILEEWTAKHPGAFEGIGVSKSVLNDVIRESYQKDTTPVAQAVHLMAGIAWAQPFSGGNKRIGITAADALLRMNGMRLVIKSKGDQEAIRDLLYEIQEERAKLNRDTLGKITLYVSKRVGKSMNQRVPDNIIIIRQSMAENRELLEMLGREEPQEEGGGVHSE